jgi:hypothetical protein
MSSTNIKENEVLNGTTLSNLDKLNLNDASALLDKFESNINWKAPQVACSIAQYPSMKFDKTEKQFTLV